MFNCSWKKKNNGWSEARKWKVDIMFVKQIVKGYLNEVKPPVATLLAK